MSVNNTASITYNCQFRQTNPHTVKKHSELFKNTDIVDLHYREKLINFSYHEIFSNFLIWF